MANKAILIGHVGKAPDYRVTPSGAEVVSFSLATTERWASEGEKKEDTSWHQVVFWGKLAKLCKDYVSKGAKVYVEGRIKYEQYEKDGVVRYVTKIIGERIEFLSKKEADTPAEKSSDQPYIVDDADIPF